MARLEEEAYYEEYLKTVAALKVEIESMEGVHTEEQIRAYVAHSLACIEAEGWGYSIHSK